jgi:pimeloyl-ACP methyl ester carboxylesterase
LGIARPIVIGHSLGGAIAQIYAVRYPVSGVVLVEGLTLDLAAPVVSRLGSYQALSLFARLGLLRSMGALLAHPAYPEATRATMIALRANSQALQRLADEGAIAAKSAVAELSAAESHLTAPLLIIAAEKSDVPGLSTGEFAQALQALAARKPQSTFVLIPEASHYVMADHPNEVVNAIEAWVNTKFDLRLHTSH